MVDFTGRLGVRLGGRRQHVIERGGDAFGMGCVGLPSVVDHLVFVPKGRIASIQHKILESAVARGCLLPVPLQLELFELAIAEQVPAASAKAMQPVVLNIPAFGRKGVLPETVPAISCGPVKQKPPAGGFFIGGELIGWCRRKERRGSEDDG